MNVLFCCHDFKNENLRLMPWRYLYEIAKGLTRKGNNVSVISVENTDTVEKNNIGGCDVFAVSRKNLFSTYELVKLFKETDIIVWSSSPLTYLFNKKLKAVNKPFVLLFTGPFYTFSEVKKAQTLNVPFRQLASHYKNAAVPLKFTIDLINSEFVKKAVVLSERNADILKNRNACASKVTVIPPGYDRNIEKQFNIENISVLRNSLGLPEGQKIFTYMGSLYQIRGINILIDAFNEVCQKIENVLLLILARTNDKTEIERVTKLIKKYGILNKVKLFSGFLDKKKVSEYLYASDAVVLPFILVPSDMPLGALEAMAMGKPVIATDIDGMPEMIKDGGIIVKPGDKEALSDAIINMAHDSNLYNSFRDKCISYMSKYPTWQDITNKFLSVIL